MVIARRSHRLPLCFISCFFVYLSLRAVAAKLQFSAITLRCELELMKAAGFNSASAKDTVSSNICAGQWFRRVVILASLDENKGSTKYA